MATTTIDVTGPELESIKALRNAGPTVICKVVTQRESDLIDRLRERKCIILPILDDVCGKKWIYTPLTEDDYKAYLRHEINAWHTDRGKEAPDPSPSSTPTPSRPSTPLPPDEQSPPDEPSASAEPRAPSSPSKRYTPAEPAAPAMPAEPSPPGETATPTEPSETATPTDVIPRVPWYKGGIFDGVPLPQALKHKAKLKWHRLRNNPYRMHPLVWLMAVSAMVTQIFSQLSLGFVEALVAAKPHEHKTLEFVLPFWSRLTGVLFIFWTLPVFMCPALIANVRDQYKAYGLDTGEDPKT